MRDTDAKRDWESYVAYERARIEPFLARRGFALDDEQPQTIGERYLTRPIGGGRKVVFFGRRKPGGPRVVIKTSSEDLGKDELRQEQRVRNMLQRIKFAYQVFALPAVILFDPSEGVLVTEYVEQDMPFLGRTLAKQFSIALGAFKAQESAHATTYGHRAVARVFGGMNAKQYYLKAGEYRKIDAYAQDLAGLLIGDEELYSRLDSALDKTIELIRDNEEVLDRYGDFLTHWDFIPQNFRIRDGRLYLLDHTSIRFGNKYEGWARFINFMTLYNPPLADAFVEYVRLNRTPEESLALKIMRAYRLVELIRYYATWLSKTSGDLHQLSQARVRFWSQVLESVLDDTPVPEKTLADYKKERGALRSDEEKRRQKDLH